LNILCNSRLPFRVFKNFSRCLARIKLSNFSL
jgi:hypothetical protein